MDKTPGSEGNLRRFIDVVNARGLPPPPAPPPQPSLALQGAFGAESRYYKFTIQHMQCGSRQCRCPAVPCKRIVTCDVLRTAALTPAAIPLTCSKALWLCVKTL